MSSRITITIDRKVYQKLKEKGIFGETYSNLISRLIDGVEDKHYNGEKVKVE